MFSLDSLYHRLTEEAGRTGGAEGIDCLTHPERYAPVIRTGTCSCGTSDQETPVCLLSCVFDAIVRAPDGTLTIDASRCCGCEACIRACSSGKLTASRDILPVIDALRSAKGPVYALIAPAFIGQFPNGITPGQLRAAFLSLGFSGMVEAALFADLLTLKEAFEFDRQIKDRQDFQLTSCCCPVWISMIRKYYHELLPHVPPAVSPMIACGRTVKFLHPDAVTVFIGPCLAKKAEAREPDIADAVDYVLTFQEVQSLFEALEIHPEQFPDTPKEHSSYAGRIYARSGGVSEAVTRTVMRLNPHRAIGVHPKHADGVPACRQMIEELKNGWTDANFFEGMGCIGGCVGGPKALLPRAQGAAQVEQYAKEAPFRTPLDNPNVLLLLKRLGFETAEDFLENSDLFTRKF